MTLAQAAVQSARPATSGASAGSAHPTHPEVEAALREVLARPEYAPPEPPPLIRWMMSAREWFGTHVWPLLDRILPDLDLSSPGWTAAARIAAFAGALLGLALIGYLLFIAVRGWRLRRRGRRRPGTPEAAAPRTAAEWEAVAREAAARGEWRQGALALYQAVMLRMGEAGVVQVSASKTPGDYRREVRRTHEAVLPRLDLFLRWFERVAYGRAAPGAEQFERLSDSARTLLSHG